MVNVGIDVGVLMAIVACAISVASFIQAGRKVAMAEGRHLEEVRNLKTQVTALEAEVKATQACYQSQDGDIREIRADMTWVKQALEEIKETLAELKR